MTKSPWRPPAAYFFKACLLPCVLVARSGSSVAQILAPFEPLNPTSMEQCRDFQERVQNWEGQVREAHDKCLRDHNAEPENRKLAPEVCTRSACQSLHNMLSLKESFLYSSIGGESKKVEDCFAAVRELQAQDASNRQRAAQDEAIDRQRAADQEAAERQRQAESQQRRRDEQARRDSQAQQTRQHNADALNAAIEPPTYAASAPSIATSGATASSIVVHETQEQYRARMIERARTEELRAAEVLKDMADPFGSSKFAAATAPENRDSTQSEMVNPFSSAHDKPGEEAILDPIKEAALDVENKVVDTQIESAVSQIKREVEVERKALPPKEFQLYENEAAHDTSFMERLGSLLKIWNYGTHFGLIAVATTPQERHEAKGDLMQDAFTDGLIYVAKRVSTRVAAVLEGSVGAAAGIMLHSRETDNGPMGIVFDKAIYDVNEKRAAFDSLNITQKRAAIDGLVSDYNSARAHYTWGYYQWLREACNEVYNAPSGSNDGVSARP
jgi:hypothetical protein